MNKQLLEKWAPVLDHPALPQIKDQYRRQVTAVLLENQERAMSESYQGVTTCIQHGLHNE
jgi:hypothetical protein